MGHKCFFEDTIVIEESQIVRVVTAFWTSKDGEEYYEDVYKEYECGKIKGRYLSFKPLGGHVVTFPGEKLKDYDYGGFYICGEREYREYVKMNLFISSCILIDEEYLIRYRPELKFLITKYKGRSNEVFLKLVQNYKEYPNIEALVEMGFYKLALNKSLQKLKKNNIKEVINFVKENREDLNEHTMLKDIQFCIKNKIKYLEIKKFKYCGSDLELFNYLKKKNIDYSYYEDYIEMCEKVCHDLTDLYWKYPNDIYKAHDKVMEQLKNIENVNWKFRENLLMKVVKNLIKNNKIINGYEIKIPQTKEEIEYQSDVLSQCLILNNYTDKMLNQENILVFILKDDVPLATAELFYDKKIGQFYGDEKGHRNGSFCKPEEEVEQVFYKWLETAEIKKQKFKYTKKYYKGFYKKEKEFFIGHNNYRFEVGKEYKTDFDDKDILIAGKKCKSTSRVFHFCDNIQDILKHYTSEENLFCEVVPLGPIIDANGALLSNKIKIIKQLSKKEVEQQLKY